MTKLQKTIATATAASAILLQSALPAFAVDLVITGNGSDSDSDIEFQSSNETVISQVNKTEVENKIKVSADTGNNSASDNTGGDIHLETGDADVHVEIENVLNSNVAEVESCGSCIGDAYVEISGNGEGSNNKARLGILNQTALFQDNDADVDNDVKVDAETGNNKADDNTGADVVVVTGDVDVWVEASTYANSNAASLGASDGDGSDVGVAIIGNGSDTKNGVELALLRGVSVVQDNQTEIENDFEIWGSSGDNSASDNTGGDIAIGTGDVYITALVDNMAGFNFYADGDCCFDDVWAKIGENGTESENFIKASLDTFEEVFQENSCGGKRMRPNGLLSFFGGDHHGDDACFENELALDGYTGGNKADDNTGDAESDPIILTGDADVWVEVGNEGGSNVVGGDFEWPWGDSNPTSGLNLDISIDLGDLLDYLGYGHA